ncbi:hypothetical protein SEA_DELAGARZA_37 [Microbacterium phage DelaGarza]|nr:hypothetical protein SEA_DELAGARZA_37 [Microbacterium phage DelaGarza]
MARVHRVQRSNKEHTCGVGGHVIPKGEPYLWAKPGFRTRTPKVRCVNHPFRESDLATGMNQEPLAAREEFIDALDSLEEFDYDGLREAVETFQSALDDYVSVREEALDAWENGNSTLEEYRDNAQQARGDFEPDVDEFSDEEPEGSEFEDDDDGHDEFEAAHDAWESERQDHWDNAVEEARSAAEGLDL